MIESLQHIDFPIQWTHLGEGQLSAELRELSQQLGVQDFHFKPNSSGYMIANGNAFPNYELMPDGDQPPPGWSAVCITAWKLSGQPKWAERIEPTEKIHRSIYLYYFPPNPQSPHE